MSLLKLLSKDSYLMYNKSIARKYGVEEAIVLACLISRGNLYQHKEFYCKRDIIIHDTALSDRAVRLATKNLYENNLISVEKKGNPCRYFFTLNEEIILNVIANDVINDDFDSTSGVKSDSTSGIKSDSTSGVKSDSTSGVKSDSTFNKIKDNINYKNKEIGTLSNFDNSKNELKILKALTSKEMLVPLASYESLFYHKEEPKRLELEVLKGMLEEALQNTTFDIDDCIEIAKEKAKNQSTSHFKKSTFIDVLINNLNNGSNELNILLKSRYENQSQINQARQRENEKTKREEENKKWYETYTTMFDITESELDRLSRMKFDDVCIGAFVLSGEDDEAMHNDLVRYITENKHRLSQIDTEPSKSDTDSNYTSDVENSAVNENVSISDVVNNMNYKSNYNKPNANKLLKQFGISDDTISK